MTPASAPSMIQTHPAAIARSARLPLPGTGVARNVAIAIAPPARTLAAVASRHSSRPTTPMLVMRIILRSAKSETTGFAIFAGCVAGVTTERTHPQRFYLQARGEGS